VFSAVMAADFNEVPLHEVEPTIPKCSASLKRLLTAS
jgi:hypothetical protein